MIYSTGNEALCIYSPRIHFLFPQRGEGYNPSRLINAQFIDSNKTFHPYLCQTHLLVYVKAAWAGAVGLNSAAQSHEQKPQDWGGLQRCTL